MSNFTVSARKYRPGIFETVVGQDHVTQTLRNAIKNNHLGQALLFCGPRGVGKTTCARILAKALNCENLSADGEPCNECNSCKSFNQQSSFNIFELDAASNNSVENIRELVDQVRFAPQHGKYKIYIIDEVHMLSSAAFNAFLKTLEEPPSYAVFILATTEKHKILPTILSRCQIFDFHRIGVKAITEQLKTVSQKEGIKSEDEALYIIAQKADGALRDALSIFDRIISSCGDTLTYKDVIENLNLLDYEYYFKVFDFVLEQKLSDTLLLFDEILNKGFDSHNFLNGMSEHIRNLIVCKDVNTIRLMEVSEDVQQKYKTQSTKASMSILLSALNLLNQFDINFKASKNGRLHVELGLMKLCHLHNAIHFSPNGDSHEKKKSELSKAADFNRTSVVEAKPKQTTPPVKTPMNLEAIRNQLNAQKPVENNASLFKTDESSPYQKINLETFKAIWEGYTNNLRERGKAGMVVAAENCKIEINEADAVIMEVENDTIKSQFLEDRIPFKDYINTTFNISNLRIEYQVAITLSKESKPYMSSNREIYNKMLEINPAIKELQERLGLKVD